MNLKEVQKIFFVGIGGIGMSALARYFNKEGKEIFGYDKVETVLTKKLVSEGMKIHYEDNVALLPDNIDLVVYTPAIPSDHKELNFLEDNGYRVIKRAEMLGELSKSKKTIAIAGTHGKTSTSAMTAHLLKCCGVDSPAFIGGIMTNYGSNYVEGKGEWIVLEADEYDRSFHHLNPDIAAVMSMDADHLDIYGDGDEMKKSFETFLMKINPRGLILLRKGLFRKLSNHTLKNLAEKEVVILEFAVEDDGDIIAENVKVKDGVFHFRYEDGEEEPVELVSKLSGRHNVENAIVAVTIARALGASNKEILDGLSSFEGIKRRFEKIIETPEMVYIDDYAHHPTELMAAIGAAKELYPEKKVTGIFQPHLYSRTRDFAEDFAIVLEEVDRLLIMDIYPARELPIDGVTSDIIFDKVNQKNKVRVTKETLINELFKTKNEVILTLGAGDIDLFVSKIKKEIQKN